MPSIRNDGNTQSCFNSLTSQPINPFRIKRKPRLAGLLDTITLGGRPGRRLLPEKLQAPLQSILASQKEVIRVKLEISWKRLRFKFSISKALVFVILLLWV